MTLELRLLFVAALIYLATLACPPGPARTLLADASEAL